MSIKVFKKDNKYYFRPLSDEVVDGMDSTLCDLKIVTVDNEKCLVLEDENLVYSIQYYTAFVMSFIACISLHRMYDFKKLNINEEMADDLIFDIFQNSIESQNYISIVQQFSDKVVLKEIEKVKKSNKDILTIDIRLYMNNFIKTLSTAETFILTNEFELAVFRSIEDYLERIVDGEVYKKGEKYVIYSSQLEKEFDVTDVTEVFIKEEEQVFWSQIISALPQEILIEDEITANEIPLILLLIKMMDDKFDACLEYPYELEPCVDFALSVINLCNSARVEETHEGIIH